VASCVLAGLVSSASSWAIRRSANRLFDRAAWSRSSRVRLSAVSWRTRCLRVVFSVVIRAMASLVHSASRMFRRISRAAHAWGSVRTRLTRESSSKGRSRVATYRMVRWRARVARTYRGLAAHVLGDEGAGGVDGGALGTVRGGGVQQLDMVMHVGGGEGDQPAVGEVADPQRPVVQAVDDVPGVAVLDPVPAGEQRQPPVVAPGDDPVAGPGQVAVPEPDAVCFDLPGGDAVGAGAGGQPGDVGGVGGGHQGDLPGEHVVLPAVVGGLGHVLA
jgi:hypothetical protein